LALREKKHGKRAKRSFELRMLTKNRGEVPFEVTFQGLSGYTGAESPGKSVSSEIIGVARDITIRKEYDERLAVYRRGLEQEVGAFKELVTQLNKIGIALSSEHNLADLLEMIVREMRSFTKSDGGSLYIKEGDELSFEVAQNDTFLKRYGKVSFKSFKIPINHDSIAGYVASTGEILNIPCLDEVGDDVPFSLTTMRDFDKKMDYKSVSMLAAPMRDHKDEIIGVIQLINSLDRDGNAVPFDKDLQELVISLSSQAAVAICNSRFIQDIKNLFESIVTYSAQAIDARSPHTAGHSQRVARLALLQAKSVNEKTDGPLSDLFFDDERMNEIRISALLHDIGKIGVRERVLDKVNKLSDAEIEAVVNRFHYIMRDIQKKAAERKLESDGMTDEELFMIDEETGAQVRQLESELELIRKLNLPKYYSDEEGERLENIAGKTYIDINDQEKPYLTQYEYENLIVRKGNLTRDERKEIESHVRHTLNILEKIPFTDELINVPEIAATHHEMLNGTGYPKGLTAKDIPMQARMLAIADIYDALTAKDRPYKPPLPLNITLKILREEAENGRLDGDLVDLFISQETYNRMQEDDEEKN
ncbi:MAG: GAF domain-containing protein, partial [Candidatus Latescibacteria bacterium]|nr:GAF domain-containing protein [Candidatus Latescibacterota bacterium]